MASSRIFISYSHNDREWLSRLLVHLGVLQQEGLVKAWSDQHLKPGDEWPREIREALDSAEIAVLLVSADFLNSQFIRDKEIPVLLERMEAGTLKVLPLLVRPCSYELSRLKHIEARPKHRDSVAGGSPAEQERDFRDLTAEIANLLVTGPRPSNRRKKIGEGEPPGTIRAPSSPQSTYAVLDIRLSHREWDRYCVELGFTHSGDSRDHLPLTHFVSFDLPKLVQIQDNAHYAKQLRDLLFPEPSHEKFLRAAQDAANELQVPLHLRISISADARELHWLRWELLILGGKTENDLSYEFTSLVRYAAADARNWRDIQHRPKRQRLNALLVAGLTDWFDASVPPVGTRDMALERCDRAREILEASGLATPQVRGYLNSEAFRNELRVTVPDILYLGVDVLEVGELPKSGNVGVEWWSSRLVNLPVAEAFRGIEMPPRLVILFPVVRGARSRGLDSHSAWLSILREAYELAQVGVLGVLTLQANLDISRWDTFFRVFLDNLPSDGRMDHALHTARTAIIASGRQWAPVLISCLRTARIWYEPRFTEEAKAKPTWETLLRRIKKMECTPIIGPGLNSTIARLRSEIALSWAENYQYPMAFHERISLPQVAQYIASVYGDDFTYEHYEEKIREIMLHRYGEKISTEQRRLPLDDFLTEAGKTFLGQASDEPHKILAELPFRLYVTASLNSFLSDALRRSQKVPREVILGLAESSGAQPSFEPSPEQPLVYHLFGHFSDLRNSVLTEDDYFDFLIHFWKEKEAIPSMVRAALINTSLLFLGFRMHHWDFRVLFRSLLAQEGAKRRAKHTHVAVQIDPDDDQVVDPERARDYLENYFSDFADADINVYWGSAEDFLKELKGHWDRFEKEHSHENV